MSKTLLVTVDPDIGLYTKIQVQLKHGIASKSKIVTTGCIMEFFYDLLDKYMRSIGCFVSFVGSSNA